MAYVPSSTPDLGFLDALTDPGLWREQRVTHWHLTLTESGTNDRERYTVDRWHRIESQDFVGTETDPRRALVWITEQRAKAISRSSDPEAFARRVGWNTRADFEFQALCSWDSLTVSGRTPAGGGVAVRDGLSVEIYTNPDDPGRVFTSALVTTGASAHLTGERWRNRTASRYRN